MKQGELKKLELSQLSPYKVKSCKKDQVQEPSAQRLHRNDQLWGFGHGPNNELRQQVRLLTHEGRSISFVSQPTATLEAMLKL